MNRPFTRREGEVWKACDDLFAQGIPFYKMTIDVVVKRLLELGYKKGSPNQIYQYRNSWKESRGIQDSHFQNSNQVVLSDPISRAAALVREEIQTEADQRINQIKEESEKTIRETTERYEVLKSQLQEIIERMEQKEKEFADSIKNTRFNSTHRCTSSDKSKF